MSAPSADYECPLIEWVFVSSVAHSAQFGARQARLTALVFTAHPALPEIRIELPAHLSHRQPP